jgi:carboxylesterase type B
MFSNIRYAQPPVGALRFAPPEPPTGRNPDIENGNKPVVCPQSIPDWFGMSDLFAKAFAAGTHTSFNYEDSKAAAAARTAQLSEALRNMPGISEDCLFLDVYVPANVMNAAKNPDAGRLTGGSPVVVW